MDKHYVNVPKPEKMAMDFCSGTEETAADARRKVSGYKLKTTKQAKAVSGAYKKIEDTVVGGYKKIEDTAVGSYKKIEGKFVDTFLEKAEGRGHGETPPDSEG